MPDSKVHFAGGDGFPCRPAHPAADDAGTAAPAIADAKWFVKRWKPVFWFSTDPSWARDLNGVDAEQKGPGSRFAIPLARHRSLLYYKGA